jgi:RND superfamily putative drug exporter
MPTTGLLTRLGEFTVHHRRSVLALTVVFIVAAGVFGTRAFSVMEDGGFEDPSSESHRAGEAEGRFGSGEPDVVVIATAAGGDVDAPDASAAGVALTERVSSVKGVGSVTSYWTSEAPPSLRSQRGDSALLLVDADGDEEEVLADLEDVGDELASRGAVLEVAIGGGEAVGAEFGETIEGDMARAESIAIPITLVLLVLVFGGLLAASLPLFVGVIAILGTFLSLYVIGSITDVSIYAINLTTALGLGLAIDYSLFIVSRYREELRNGHSVEEAVVRSVETAGRTVTISALIVAVSLSALLVFPQYFLRSFAYAGIAVVLLAMVTAVVSLPALLAVVGTRIDALRLFHHRPKQRDEDGFWYRTATRVMRRPVPVALAVIAVLVLLGLPFLRVEFGTPDARMLPESSPARAASGVLQRDFAGDASASFPVVVEEVDGDVDAALTDLAARVSRFDGVDRVDTSAGTFADGTNVAPGSADGTSYSDGSTGWMSVVPSIEMGSTAGEDLVGEIRSLDMPYETLVGGQTAELIDTRASIADRLPWALAIIVVFTAVLLFLLSGSVLVPIKALVLNLLSLTATFGAMVWIFQDGNLSGLLDFTATGAVDTTTPILMFCIAFGLSMDYEVFLLSRIKEEHDRTGDNDHAVALGLERTGRIVTAAALLLSVTFLAFGTSGVSFIKMFGIGLAIAVLMDAFVIRGLLVPAFMKLAGDANWWAPAPLRRLHARFGIAEAPSDDVVPSPASAETAPSDPTRRSEAVG